MATLISTEETIGVVEAFDPGDDGLGAKSKDLVSMLLRHGTEPFSARQFWPGHVTCTALIFHPHDHRVLMIYHHRLHRWLLPGGHVEENDASLNGVAAREADEETHVRLSEACTPFLAGIDVHGIPPKGHEPYHLHHDLIWCFRAASEEFEITAEAPEVMWAQKSDWPRLDLSPSIRNTIARATRHTAGTR
jgi:8-oxo-dGTP pyrophosphatase MutT (NUDIX family)